LDRRSRYHDSDVRRGRSHVCGVDRQKDTKVAGLL